MCFGSNPLNIEITSSSNAFVSIHFDMIFDKFIVCMANYVFGQFNTPSSNVCLKTKIIRFVKMNWMIHKLLSYQSRLGQQANSNPNIVVILWNCMNLSAKILDIIQHLKVWFHSSVNWMLSFAIKSLKWVILLHSVHDINTFILVLFSKIVVRLLF